MSTFPSCISCGTELIFIIKKRHHLHIYILYAKSTPCSCVRGLTHILSGEVNVCSVGVLEMFQHWTLQFSARLTDKVQPSCILHYVALCLISVVINKYTCVSCADEIHHQLECLTIYCTVFHHTLIEPQGIPIPHLSGVKYSRRFTTNVHGDTIRIYMYTHHIQDLICNTVSL